ncbi:MAG: hypothetical protein GY870_14305 [archaeon]|nr:hypothetical protein [archaeon]
MTLKQEFHDMINALTSKYSIPPIKNVFFPKYYSEGQPSKAEFMAMSIEGGAVGLSYILLLDDSDVELYKNLQVEDFIGKDPILFAFDYGNDNSIKNMLSLAAINAICQHIIRITNFKLDYTTDSLGLLNIKPDDTIGMVGFFRPLVGKIKKIGAKLIIIEKKEKLIEKFPKFHITLDSSELKKCNKILCTSTTILNNTIDEILSNCTSAEQISIIGPTAGYFPDALFKRGISVVGGTFIEDDGSFFELISQEKRWGATAQKFCFQKNRYSGINELLL